MSCLKSTIARSAAIFTLALAVAPLASAQQTNRISITTGGTGGVYYPMGGGMANILSKYVPGLQATAEVTGGSIDNLKLINAGKSEVAFSMADAGWDAYDGLDKFKDGKVDAAHADGALSEQDARRDDRGHGNQQALRPQGQARVDRFARQRHRDHGVARARGGRHRRQEGLQAGAAGRRRVGQRDQGPQDRRVLLGRRIAHRGGHRSRGDAGGQDQADRSR